MRKSLLAAGVTTIVLAISYVSGAALFADYAQFGLSTHAINKTLAPLESTSTRITISLDTTLPCDPSLATCFSYYPENDQIQYNIIRTPHCTTHDTDGNCSAYAPDLCRYLAAEPDAGEFALAFGHNALDTSSVASGFGVLSPPGDPSDNWEISMVSPCFAGECPAGYDTTVYGNPLPIAQKGQTFTCDLHVDYQSIFLSLNKLAPNIAYAQVAPNVIELSAVFTGNVTPVQPACTVDCHSSVLFLPGIEASRLYRPDYSGGTDQLWEPNTNSDVTDLYLDEQGKSIRSDIYTQDTISEVNVSPFFQKNVYKSFLLDLKKWKEDDHLIADYAFAPYDWRLSLEDILNSGNSLNGKIYYSGDNAATTTPYIIQELRRLASTSRTGKVTIVAHSNGGLVTKALTEKLGTEASSLIDQIIFVAVPQVGTPQAIGALLHGYDQGLPFDWFSILLTPETARQFARTSPMTYNLLPSAAYFTYVNESAVTFDDSDLLAPWRARYGGNEIHSGELLHAFIADQSRITLPVSDSLLFPISGNEPLLNAAETLHNITHDNWTPPAGVRFTEIAGWGEKTVKNIKYYKGHKSYCSNPHDINTCIDIPALEYGVDEVLDGDGTVVVPSALWTVTSTGVAKYWVNLHKVNNDLPQSLSHLDYKHADILEVPELRELIKNTLIGISGSLQYISTASPQNTTNTPSIRFTLHSPLTLNLYDNLGNHTGISTSTGFLEENIPGSRYKTYGELKLIEAPSSTTLRLVMNGYASGSFTLNVDKELGDTVVASTTFAGVPSGTSTVASITVPQGGNFSSSPLSVDENGDGVTDMTLTPLLGTVVLPDFTLPHTTAAATGTLGLNNWYTSNVTLSFSATDTGSGVKNTFYSLDGGASWNIFASTSPLIVSAEGSTTIQYYSLDNAGNREATSTLVVKIDKTAPRASIGVDSTTKDLAVSGTDSLSTTTTAKNGNIYTITDNAGHTTKLFFQKTFTGTSLTYAKLTDVQYDNTAKVALPSSYFVYLWQGTSPQMLFSQTIIVNGTYAIEAVYDKVKNKTTVALKKKGLLVQTAQFTGIHIVKFTVNNGVVGYEL